jgi:heterodisulfide reductase subunit B
MEMARRAAGREQLAMFEELVFLERSGNSRLLESVQLNATNVELSSERCHWILETCVGCGA